MLPRQLRFVGAVALMLMVLTGLFPPLSRTAVWGPGPGISITAPVPYRGFLFRMTEARKEPYWGWVGFTVDCGRLALEWLVIVAAAASLGLLLSAVGTTTGTLARSHAIPLGGR